MSISITHSELVEALHQISHQHARLWPPSVECGCVDRADAMWAFLEEKTHVHTEACCNRIDDHERGVPHGCNGL